MTLGGGGISVPGLDPGETRELSTAIESPTNEGSLVEFLLEIDVDDEVEEADETNNELLITIQYLTAGEEPVVTVQ